MIFSRVTRAWLVLLSTLAVFYIIGAVLLLDYQFLPALAVAVTGWVVIDVETHTLPGWREWVDGDGDSDLD